MPLRGIHQWLEPAEQAHRFLEQLPIRGQGCGVGVVYACRFDTGFCIAGPLHTADSRLRCLPMAEVLLAGGITIDVATKSDLESHHRRIESMLERPHARFFRAVAGRAPRASNAPFAMKFDQGKPPAGMMYLVQWLVITGDDPTVSSAIANVRAALFAGNMQPDTKYAIVGTTLDGADFSNMIQSGIVVPSTITIPDKSVVYTGEELYVLMAGSGLSAGAGFYHATAGIIELPQRADALMW